MDEIARFEKIKEKWGTNRVQQSRNEAFFGMDFTPDRTAMKILFM